MALVPAVTYEHFAIRTPVEVLTDFRFLQNAPTILYVPIRSILVRLVLDPVLLEIWILQILLQGPHKGDGCLGEKNVGKMSSK
jgi:hypothetical protein